MAIAIAFPCFSIRSRAMIRQSRFRWSHGHWEAKNKALARATTIRRNKGNVSRMRRTLALLVGVILTSESDSTLLRRGRRIDQFVEQGIDAANVRFVLIRAAGELFFEVGNFAARSLCVARMRCRRTDARTTGALI